MQTRLTDIQETSIESYKIILDDLGIRQSQVLDVIKNHPGICNHEISNILCLPINSITPRVKELRELNLVVNLGIKKDESTNRNVMTWRCKE